MPKNTDNSRTPLPPLYKDLDGQNVCVCVCVCYTFIWFYQIKAVKSFVILHNSYHCNTSYFLFRKLMP